MERKCPECGSTEVMEGTLAPVACLADPDYDCPRRSVCKTLPMWRKLYAMINDFFDGVSIADLMLNEGNKGNDYVI